MSELIILPSGDTSPRDCARQIFRLAAAAKDLYWHGAVCTLGANGLNVVNPDTFRTWIERYGKLYAWRSGRDGKLVLQPAKMSRDDAKVILASQDASEMLPPVANVLRCPVITEHDGQPVVLSKGYHPQMGGLLILEGEAPLDMTLADARKVLLWTVEDLDFQTPADKSRALAARITPALKLGDWLSGSTPIEVMEADQPQSGKGWSHQISAAIYNTKATLVVQRTGGVGSWDESFGAAVATGTPFIGLDNVRGKLNSPYLEGFLTAPGLYTVRLAGGANIQIDPRRHVLQLTSNAMDSTPDLAARSSICRIRKQLGKMFPDSPEEIRRDIALLIGAVFTIIKEYHRQGKPRTGERRHAFHEWAQTLDWIVQNLLGQAPLMDGHEEAQERVSNPEKTWLRAVANATESTGKLDLALTASGLAEVCQSQAIVIPGMGAAKDLEVAARSIGGIMRRLFGRLEKLAIENFTVKRTVQQYRKASGDMDSRHAYTFEAI
jgi:hypothetical protein